MTNEMLELYNRYYDKLYNEELQIDELATLGFYEEQYNNNETFRNFVVLFCQVMGDCITSDREIEAFYLAYLEFSANVYGCFERTKQAY